MIASRGATAAVDWEQRIDFGRLREYRLARSLDSLRNSDLGAVLLFDQNNIRYVTSTHIGEWARDKSARCALLPREGDPVLWDFGSAARHHQMYAPWLPTSSWRAGVTSMRGAMPEATGVPDKLARQIAEALRELGLQDEPLGIDLTDMETLTALNRAGLQVASAQPVMLEARKIKSEHEIALLDHAAGIVDAVGPACMSTKWWLMHKDSCSSSAPSTSRRLTLYPGIAATLIPTCFPTGYYDRETKRSSTSSTRLWVTARATTERSLLAVPIRRSLMPIAIAASGSMRR
jgi:hypothetical protein